MASTAATTAAARGVLLIGTLATVPVVLAEVGEARLGVWLTLVTFTSLFGFADLGLGNGIMTSVARRTAAGDEAGIRADTANGFALLTVIAILLGSVAVALASTIDIPALFGVGDAESDVTRAVVWFLVLFFAGIPFSVTEKLEWGLQRGHIAGAWSLAGSVLAIAGIVISAVAGLGLVGLAVAYTAAPLAAGVVNTMWALWLRWPQFRPRRGDPAWDHMRSLLNVGVLYFVLQLSAAAAFSSDNLIIAVALGSEVVPELAVPARLFGLINFSLALAMRPMWPEFAHAIGRARHAWVRQNSLFMLGGATALATLSATVFVFTGNGLTSRLTDGTVEVGTELLMVLAAGTVLVAAGNAVSMLYNAVGEVRFQASTALVMAAVSTGLKIVLVRPMGILGVAVGGVLGYALISGIAFGSYTPKVLKRLELLDDSANDH